MTKTRNQGKYQVGMYSERLNRQKTILIAKKFNSRSRSRAAKQRINEVILMNNELIFQWVKSLKPKKNEFSFTTISAKISINLSKHLVRLYKINSKFGKNKNFISSLCLPLSNFLTNDNIIKIIDDSIQVKIAKKRDVFYKDFFQKEHKIDGSYCIVIKFKREELVI